MRTYEAVFIYDPRISDEERSKLTEKIEGIISANGTLHETNFWGKKRFAYPIQKATEGYYYLFVFDAPPTLPTELKRITAITETIFRSMIIVRKYRYVSQVINEEPVPDMVKKEESVIAPEPAIEIQETVGKKIEEITPEPEAVKGDLNAE
jgi:small subunit ribosomal protein S6